MAEKVAAREAVLWLRSHGRLDPNVDFHNHDTKRRKSTDTANVLSSGETGLTQTLLPALSVGPSDPVKDESPGNMAHYLAVALGFHTPTIQHAQVDDTVFVDTWAEFDLRDTRVEPRLAGQVGKVERIFGKKVGKEMCWREVLKVLDEIRQTRIEGC